MRAVLDPNVLISALLSREGSPARLLRAWLDGMFELITSPQLFAELERALAYPKLRDRIPTDDAEAFLGLLRVNAELHEDPTATPATRSPDRDDDYLLALAESTQSLLVSGDGDLLGLADRVPVLNAAAFLAQLDDAEG